jgi:NADP-dependent 3-hydroxy acid dehydrogenase YdfG
MVDISTVRTSNTALKSGPKGLVCVLVGATSGIGASTLKALVRDLNVPKIYIAVRSAARFSHQLVELKSLNPDAAIEVLETEISLVRKVDTFCATISAREYKVDLLYMSAGLLPSRRPQCTRSRPGSLGKLKVTNLIDSRLA